MVQQKPTTHSKKKLGGKYGIVPVGCRRRHEPPHSEAGGNKGKSKGGVWCPMCAIPLNFKLPWSSAYGSDPGRPLKVCPRGHRLPKKPYFDVR